MSMPLVRETPAIETEPTFALLLWPSVNENSSGCESSSSGMSVTVWTPSKLSGSPGMFTTTWSPIESPCGVAVVSVATPSTALLAGDRDLRHRVSRRDRPENRRRDVPRVTVTVSVPSLFVVGGFTVIRSPADADVVALRDRRDAADRDRLVTDRRCSPVEYCVVGYSTVL